MTSSHIHIFLVGIVFVLVVVKADLLSSNNSGHNSELSCTRLLLHLFAEFEERMTRKMSCEMSRFSKVQDYVKPFPVMDHQDGEAVFVTSALGAVLNNIGSIVPGSTFHKSEKFPTALSLTLENAALLSELVLHLPDICHRVLRAHKPWHLMLTWGIFFASQSTFLDSNTHKLIRL
ncbi:unnamed protein product, partial [Meganyctiphanes norvegica]